MTIAVAAAARLRRPSPGLPTRPARKHIVDVTLFFAPTSGGVRRYLMAKHSWLRGHTSLKHTIFVPGRQTEGTAYDVVRFASPAVPFGNGYRLPVRMRAFREQLARLAPDLIEVGDPYHLAWQSLKVARERRIPAVAFCHSDVITLAGGILGPVAGRTAAGYLRRTYAGFDAVFAPSATVANRLVAVGVKRVAVQPLGVDVGTLSPHARDPAIRELLGVSPHKRLLVFAGRLSPEKRVGDLVAASAILGAGYHLLLVGGSQRQARGPNITMLAYQREPRQLARIIASCDAFVHAGDQETFSLIVLEAMACGVPVMAARAGALVEIVDDTVGGTFTPRDPADLARAVGRLFERDRAEIGRAARRRAEANSWEAAFSQLLRRYSSLMPSASLTPVRVGHVGG